MTYALVGGVIAATFVGTSSTDRQTMDTLAAMAAAFFFAKSTTEPPRAS